MDDAMNNKSHAPVLRSQYMPQQSNTGWPHWGRDALDHAHAIFAAVSHMHVLGLHAWTGCLVQWLAHYDGFERYADEGHDPCICVRDLLAGYALRWGSGHGHEREPVESAHALWRRIVCDILSLDFVRYRAFWGRGLVHEPDARVWNPLKQSWLNFIDFHLPGEELWVWQTDAKPQPPLHVLREHLLHGHEA